MRRNGFSLVEMLAALTIFSLGVLGTMEVFTACLRSTSASLGYTRAAHLAQGLLEETIAEGDFTFVSDSGTFGLGYPRHSWTREIAETEELGLYQVEVEVAWTERGQEKQFTLTTLVAERS